MNSDFSDLGYQAQALLELYGTDQAEGATCALLTPAIKTKLREMAAGQILEVRVDDPSAKEDVLAWSRLSGNEVLAIFTDDARHLRFYLRKK